VKVLRNGKEITIPLTVTELKEEKLGKEAGEPGGEENSIGLVVEDLDSRLARRFDLGGEAKGVVVIAVEPGSSASDAGFRQGDIILEVNGKTVADAKTFQKMLAGQPKKSYARFLVKREGRSIILALEMPEK
jgi:serine protease Do